MKRLIHLIGLIFSMSTSAQQEKNHEPKHVNEASSSVTYQGEDGQTPAEEAE
jgi:hypothetical protein